MWTVRPAAVLIAAVPDRDRALVEETLMRRLEDLTVTALWEAEKRSTIQNHPRSETPMATATEEELAAAFTEWDRRFREEPERFQSEAARLLKGTPRTYGEACAPYLLSILGEQSEQHGE